MNLRRLIILLGIVSFGFVGFVMYDNSRCQRIYNKDGPDSANFKNGCFVEQRVRSNAATFWLD